MVATALAAVGLALAASGRGCSAADASPDGAVRAFVAASRAGDKRAVWDLLGPATRGRLETAAVAATEKVGGARRFTALDMLELWVPEQSYAPTDFAVRERSGSAAVVEVSAPGGRRDRVRVVREGRRWCVELGP